MAWNPLAAADDTEVDDRLVLGGLFEVIGEQLDALQRTRDMIALIWSAERVEARQGVRTGSSSDLTVPVETMLEVRDRVREDLVRQVHALRIAARVNRKMGERVVAARLEERVRRTVHMVNALDNPMDGSETDDEESEA